ncbi:hypothetical protein ACLKMH_14470 [Psychromonas sp. KJ10-10]|uniref:hypothetical protein n=1 Tax=Psychromonas sp. KJ10-10 TaxID=3391823 RepID=UPI0039B3FA78
MYQEDLVFLLPIAKLLKKKVIVIYHHVPLASQNESFIEKVKLLYLKLLSIFITLADKVVTPSIESSIAISNKLGISDDCFSIIYNSFDFNELPLDPKLNCKKSFLKSHGIPYKGNEKILLTVGSDESRKNLFTLLQGISKLDQNEYVFIKAGRVMVPDNNKQMIDFISKNKLNVFF